MSESQTTTSLNVAPAGFNRLVHETMKKAYGTDLRMAFTTPRAGNPVKTPALHQIRDLFTERLNHFPKAIALLSEDDKITWHLEFNKIVAELGVESDLISLPDGNFEMLQRDFSGIPHNITQFDTQGRIVKETFLEKNIPNIVVIYSYDDNGRLSQLDQLHATSDKPPELSRKTVYTYIQGAPDNQYTVTTTFAGKTDVQTYAQRMIKNLLNGKDFRSF